MIKEAKGNMYEFVSHTWNPIKGKCYHGCSYCYMDKLSPKRGEARLDARELVNACLGSGNFIFVGSSIDMFAQDIPDSWIKTVLDCCDGYNKYLFQSKNPARILEYLDHPVFERSIVCTTIETNRYYSEIMRNSPQIEDRVKAMADISARGIKTYVTTEPLMQFDLDEMVECIKKCNPVQVNIGRNTSRSVPISEPTPEEVQALVSGVEKFSKVEIKKNARTVSYTHLTLPTNSRV